MKNFMKAKINMARVSCPRKKAARAFIVGMVTEA
jgi:hypothetical protein